MRFCYSCMYQFQDRSATICPQCGEPLEWNSDSNIFLPPGTVLQSKFTLGKSLGNGGFGNTYIGWNNLLQQKVAVKEYYPRRLSKRGGDGVTVTYDAGLAAQRFQTGLHRFLEEARSLAALQSVKGIIRIYNFFEENNTGYIVMEFLEGMDLKAILKKNHGFLDYDRSRQVILTVLHTLKEIHGHGILHRDIAPDNVYVTKEGIIKLIDFGAAKHASNAGTADTEIVLKVGYAPIEQYSNSAAQGTYTDLYEVAALFYRMLTGKKPQPANERCREDHVRALSDMGIRIPEQAEMAVMCCLNIQPEFRLQTAEDFMEALGGKDFEPVYEPEWILPPVEEIAESPVAAVRQKMRKLPLTARIAIAVLAVVLLGGVGYGVKLLTSQAGAGVMAENGEVLRIPAGCINQQEKEVLDKLRASGLKADVVYNICEMEKQSVPEGTVVDIEPREGQTIPVEEHVKIIVASGKKATIPNVTKLTEEQMVKSLQDRLGSRYRKEMIVYYYNNAIEKKVCYDQGIAAGEVAGLKDIRNMKVFVSWGSKTDYMKTMPDLTGKTLSEARELLKNAGIPEKVLSVSGRKYNAGIVAGDIIGQSIGAGKKINTNAQDSMCIKHIRVELSKGPKPTEVPTVTEAPRTDTGNSRPQKTKAPRKREDNSDGEFDFSGGVGFE